MSRYYNCESRTIVFEQEQYPYSEINCDDLSGKFYIALAGPLAPLIIGLLLFIFGGKFIRPSSFLIIGFNLLASYKDFKDIGISDNFIVVGSIIGIISLFAGIGLLARDRTQAS